MGRSAPPPRRTRRRTVHLLLLLLLLVLLLAQAAAGCREQPRSLKRPNLVRLAGDGRIIVSDFHHQRIVSFDAQGRFLGSFGEQGLEQGQLWQVRAILTEGPGQLLLLNQRIASPTDTSTRWEVKRFEEGREVAVFPIAIPGVAEIEPCDLIRGSDGTYLMADDVVEEILRFDGSFRLIGRWAAPEGGARFCSPTWIRQRGGKLWVVEQSCHRLRRLSLDDGELSVIGREGRGPGELLFPIAADVCPGKWVAVADLGNRRVQRFTIDGQPLDGFAPVPAGPDLPVQLLDLVVTPSCDRLLLVDSKGNRVLVTTPEGQVLQVLSSW